MPLLHQQIRTHQFEVDNLGDFSERRSRAYQFLRYNTDTSQIPDSSVPEEFTKENLRVSLQLIYMTEISDIDGIFWGN